MAALKLGLAVLIAAFLREVQAGGLPFGLDQGSVPLGNWATFNADGPLGASVRDFRNGRTCTRLIVFHARGMVMEYISRSCNTLKSLMGLVEVDSSIYFYNEVMAKQESGNTFVVIVAQSDQTSCSKNTYSVTRCESCQGMKLEKKVTNRETVPATDKDCQDLVQGNKINMMLLSGHGRVMGFKKRGKLNEYNYWKPLGASMQLYYNGGECYRLLNFVSLGRPIVSVKVSCGPVQGLIMRDDALIYGNAIMVKPGEYEDSFTIFFNYRDYTCVKKKISFFRRGRRLFRELISREVVYKISVDQECQNFLQRKMVLNEKTVAISGIDSSYDQLADEKTDVPVEDEQLKEYKANSKWSTFNLQMPLGVMVRTYNKDKADCIRFIMFTSEGVPIDSVTTPCGDVQPPVTQELAILKKEVTIKGDGAETPVTQESVTLNKEVTTKGDGAESPVTQESVTLNKEVTTKGDGAETPVPQESATYNKEATIKRDDDQSPVKRELATYNKEAAVVLDDAQVLVTQDHALFYNKVAMVKRDPESNQITILVNDNDATCKRKEYALEKNGERLEWKKTSCVAAIQKESDPECKDLIEGKMIEKPKSIEF